MPPSVITQSPKQVHLNSVDGKAFYSIDTSELYYFFQTPIFNVSENVHVYLTLQSLSIPYSFPNINEYNNVFSYVVYDLVSSTTTTITIPIGQYNVKQLVDYFNSNSSFVSSGVVMSYDCITRRITIKSLYANQTISILKGSLLDLGIDVGVNSTLDPTLLTATLTGTRVLNLIRTQCLYIDICEMTTENLVSYSGRQSSIVARIPIAGEYGSVINWVNTTGYYSRITNTSASFLHIRILDDLGRVMNLNNMNYNCTFQIDYESKGDNNNLGNLFPKFSWQE